MDRVSMCNRVGNEYKTTNIEGGEYSYVQAAGSKEKLINAIGYEPKKREDTTRASIVLSVIAMNIDRLAAMLLHFWQIVITLRFLYRKPICRGF